MLEVPATSLEASDISQMNNADLMKWKIEQYVEQAMTSDPKAHDTMKELWSN